MFNLLTALVGPAALIVASLIVRSIRKPSDRERALLLSQIANDAADLLLSSFTNPPPFATLLDQLVTAISNAAGLPTSNRDAIKRAAASALTLRGVKP